jgi:anti-sigma-K factor RskA
MNDKMHIAEVELTLYAMGAVEPDEARRIEEHLQSCAGCREELRQNMLALAAYAQTTPEAALPSGAKDRFMVKVSRTPQVSAAEGVKTSSAQSAPVPQSPLHQEQSASFWQKIFGSGGWSPALAGAFALALIAVGIDDLNRRADIGSLVQQAKHGQLDSAQLAQLMELLTSPEAKRVSLHTGPVSAPPPEGRVVYTGRNGKLLLTASNLKPLPEGKTYELWILQPGGKAPLPAGTFAPDASGNAAMIVANTPGLSVQGFGVTIENAGGSQTPTLPIVLSGL